MNDSKLLFSEHPGELSIGGKTNVSMFSDTDHADICNATGCVVPVLVG
ncbi:hypothetical protein [Bradyrhizobium sp. WSM2254]|nr:hypothetical protein [Bradyrhizobium sp. WSM2254]